MYKLSFLILTAFCIGCVPMTNSISANTALNMKTNVADLSSVKTNITNETLNYTENTQTNAIENTEIIQTKQYKASKIILLNHFTNPRCDFPKILRTYPLLLSDVLYVFQVLDDGTVNVRCDLKYLNHNCHGLKNFFVYPEIKNYTTDSYLRSGVYFYVTNVTYETVDKYEGGSSIFKTVPLFFECTSLKNYDLTEKVKNYDLTEKEYINFYERHFKQ